jgi:hypothetical protein
MTPKSNPRLPKVATLDAKCLLDALTRAIEFQRNQPMNGVEVVIALTEVRDAVKYAINPIIRRIPQTRRRGKGKKFTAVR